MPFELPPLPYDYDALEPTIDAKTMEIHHGKHHQAYVTNLNAALDGTEWADRSIEDVITNLPRSPRRSAQRCATTAAATSTTRCSGRSCSPAAAATPPARSRSRSTTPSAIPTS